MENIYLQGSEAVARAGSTIQSAAEDMRQASINMSQTAQDIQRVFDNFKNDLEQILNNFVEKMKEIPHD